MARKLVDSKSALGGGEGEILVDPRPQFSLSPYLFMQFMEPLGVTDGSVEAGWDFGRNCWREDLLAVTRELAPTLIRWPGGCFSSYYRWKEGVGARGRRKPMLNLAWSGMESNQVGTHEFIDFCRQVGAEPLIAVNFEADGRKHWSRASIGGVRSAGPREAAAWVEYCNSRANVARRANGARPPFGVRLWQIGNETSYDRRGFDCKTAGRKTLAFARAMRQADPDIELIGWGDSGWAGRMLEVAGGELQYLAFHHHFGPGSEESPLRGTRYRQDPGGTWRELMNAHKSMAEKIGQMRRQIVGSDVALAMTEGHFSLPGRNRCEVLSSWAAGVAYARILNVQARNGDVLKIATLADFCGTRWMVNAVTIPVPGWRHRAYMMPVARVMSLYRKHMGKQAVAVAASDRALDVTASRSGAKVFLHVVNTQRRRAVRARLGVEGMSIVGGRAFEMADDPQREITELEPGAFAPKERSVPAGGRWQFPAASVTAIELRVRPKRR